MTIRAAQPKLDNSKKKKKILGKFILLGVTNYITYQVLTGLLENMGATFTQEV